MTMKITQFTMTYFNNLIKIKFFLYLIIVLLGYKILFAQDNSEKVQIINADLMVGSQTESGLIRSYFGNIILKHNNIEARCDTAYQYFTNNSVKLLGNVFIKQDRMILKSSIVRYDGNSGISYADKMIEITDGDTYLAASQGRYNTKSLIANFYQNVNIKDNEISIIADSARYNRKNQNSEAKGNVLAENDSFMIISDYLFYHRESRESKSYGNVFFKGKYDNIYLVADTVINIPKIKYTSASGKPILFKVDSTIMENVIKYDTLSISSNLMEAIREKKENEKFIFTDSVEIIRDNVKAKADNAIYFAYNELLFLYGNPVLWMDSLQLKADSIVIYMPDRELKLIHSFGNAFIASKDDTNDIRRINQLLGESIKIYISEKKVEKIECIGNAKSLYYLTSENTFDGVNINSCDTINIYFEKGKPVEVHWLGKVEGEYYPEKMVWREAERFYLPKFEWLQNIPTKKYLTVPQNVNKKIHN